MGACSIPECTNRSEKGFKVKQCPQAPKRRAKWIAYLQLCGYKKEIPKIFHICEIHFNSFYAREACAKEDPSVSKDTWKGNILVVSS
jgi:hypothetical protein